MELRALDRARARRRVEKRAWAVAVIHRRQTSMRRCSTNCSYTLRLFHFRFSGCFPGRAASGSPRPKGELSNFCLSLHRLSGVPGAGLVSVFLHRVMAHSKKEHCLLQRTCGSAILSR